MRRSTRLAVLAAAFAGLALTGCGKKPAPAPPLATVVVAHPMQQQVVDWDDFVGRFEAVDSVDVRPRVSGYLQTIAFHDGDIVRKGQLLFVIDPRPYQAALDNARGQEAHAQATLHNAEVELKRAQGLYAAHAISEQELETRVAAQAQAAADLLAAQGTVKTAALNLSFTRIASPVAGRVSDRRYAVGNLVTQDSTILTNVVTIDPIRFSFEGPESLYLKYDRENEAGTRRSSRVIANPVLIRLQDEASYRWKGRMDFVDNTLDTQSGTIRGRAVVDNPRHFLTPGMFGHLRLLGSGAYTALLVPDQAVATDQTRQIVYVVGADGKVAQRLVTPGALVNGLRIIREGLKPDDFVVVDGLQSAKPGNKVSTRRIEIKGEAQDPAAAATLIQPTPSAAAPADTVR
jgi:RND family efflux transporter MFP subunit